MVMLRYNSRSQKQSTPSHWQWWIEHLIRTPLRRGSGSNKKKMCTMCTLQPRLTQSVRILCRNSSRAVSHYISASINVLLSHNTSHEMLHTLFVQLVDMVPYPTAIKPSHDLRKSRICSLASHLVSRLRCESQYPLTDRPSISLYKPPLVVHSLYDQIEATSSGSILNFNLPFWVDWNGSSGSSELCAYVRLVYDPFAAEQLVGYSIHYKLPDFLSERDGRDHGPDRLVTCLSFREASSSIKHCRQACLSNSKHGYESTGQTTWHKTIEHSECLTRMSWIWRGEYEAKGGILDEFAVGHTYCDYWWRRCAAVIVAIISTLGAGFRGRNDRVMRLTGATKPFTTLLK